MSDGMRFKPEFSSGCSEQETEWITAAAEALVARWQAAELWDGRFFTARAGCNYTGWECQASGCGQVADNLDELWRLGIEPESIERLKGATQ